MSEIPAKSRDPAVVKSMLRQSDQLEDLGPIAQSWFEDDPEIVRAVASSRGTSKAKRVDYLLQTVMEQRREKWADIFLRSAALLRDVSGDLCWPELTLVAKAVAEGQDLAEIGLMRDIALRTLAVHSDRQSDDDDR